MAKYKYSNGNKIKIVERLKENCIPYWELAEQLDMHENTIAKWMRRPTDEQTAQIMAAIDGIIKRHDAEAEAAQIE